MTVYIGSCIMCVCVETAALWGVSLRVNHGLLSIFSLKSSPFPPVLPSVTLTQCCRHSHIRALRDGAALHREKDREFLLRSCLHSVHWFTSREKMHQNKCGFKSFVGTLFYFEGSVTVANVHNTKSICSSPFTASLSVV